jgi:threonine/homoserine/homoserine lactone efflux protein
VLNLLAAMSPGADFAIVTTNTLLYSRRAGIVTALGIGSAILIHVAYCLLGFAVLLTTLPGFFRVVAILGGAYLGYVGVNSLRARHQLISMKAKAPATQAVIPLVTAWRQGFFTNLLNVKCILYFLAIFSYVPIANMTLSFALVIEIELFCVVVAWFSLLSVILTHPRWKHALQRATPTIVGLMGWLLLFVGAWLVLQGIFKSAL